MFSNIFFTLVGHWQACYNQSHPTQHARKLTSDYAYTWLPEFQSAVVQMRECLDDSGILHALLASATPLGTH